MNSAACSIETRNAMILSHLRLVAYIASKFSNTGEENDDLVSVGTIGLIKAVNSYDPVRNARLATYAARCIENEILMYLRCSRKYLRQLPLENLGYRHHGPHEFVRVHCFMPEQNEISARLEQAEELEALRSAIAALNPREQKIIRLRYGLNTGSKGGRTQKEVAALFGISQSYLSRVEQKIMKQLRQEIAKIL